MNKNYKFSKDSKILTIKTHIGNFKFLKEETIQFPKSFNTKKIFKRIFY